MLVIARCTDGHFRSLNLGLFINPHPQLRHARTRVKSSAQNGPRDRRLGAPNYEGLFIVNSLTTADRSKAPTAIGSNLLRCRLGRQTPRSDRWRHSQAWSTPPSHSNEKKSCQLRGIPRHITLSLLVTRAIAAKVT